LEALDVVTNHIALINMKVRVFWFRRINWWRRRINWWSRRINRRLCGIINAANIIAATWAKAGKYFVSPIGIARASATTFTRPGCTSIVRFVGQNLKRQELGFTNPLIISHWRLASDIFFAKGFWSVGSSA